MKRKAELSNAFATVIGLAVMADDDFVAQMNKFAKENPALSAETVTTLGLITYAYNMGYGKAMEDNGIKE